MKRDAILNEIKNLHTAAAVCVLIVLEVLDESVHSTVKVSRAAQPSPNNWQFHESSIVIIQHVDVAYSLSMWSSTNSTIKQHSETVMV